MLGRGDKAFERLSVIAGVVTIVRLPGTGLSALASTFGKVKRLKLQNCSERFVFCPDQRCY